MRHPPAKSPSEAVDEALRRVERATEKERQRRLSSRPNGQTTPPRSTEVERAERGDDDETLDFEELAPKD